MKSTMLGFKSLICHKQKTYPGGKRLLPAESHFAWGQQQPQLQTFYVGYEQNTIDTVNTNHSNTGVAAKPFSFRV